MVFTPTEPRIRYCTLPYFAFAPFARRWPAAFSLAWASAAFHFSFHSSIKLAFDSLRPPADSAGHRLHEPEAGDATDLGAVWLSRGAGIEHPGHGTADFAFR